MERERAELSGPRLLRLLEVGRGLVAELDIEAVLDRVLEVARELTGAKYAALGVLDPAGRELERFITAGVDAETHRAIGSLPRGRGVLGVLIEQPEPLRLHDVGRHPKSYGFPPGHPEMSTFLGVPIRVRGEVYGNLYLTEKAGGADFAPEDEEAISVLADWAAIAIDNARAYAREHERRHELERTMNGLRATIDIARALGGETDLDRVLELIVKRARALVDAETVLILLADEARTRLTVAALAGAGDMAMLGDSVPVEGSLTGNAFASHRSVRLTEVNRLRYALADRVTAESGLLMPLMYRGRALGVLAAFDHGARVFTADDEQLLDSFANSAATAVATAQRVAEQGLRRSIEASERERTRWARELHDETLQELAGLKVLLTAGDGQPGPDAIAAAVEQIELSITGLRHLITELRPAALDEYGLGAAVEALVQRVAAVSGLEIVADVALLFEGGLADERLDPEAENAAYRLVQEALTNITRHADATRVTVSIQEGAADLAVEISDDGRGFDVGADTGGFGLRGMRERVALAGGEIELASTPGAGTHVRARIPSRRGAEPVRLAG